MHFLRLASLLLSVFVAQSQAQIPLPFDPSAFSTGGTLSAPIVGVATRGGTPGGSFVVDNQLIIVPENFLIDVPTQTLSWPDFVASVKGPIIVQVQGNRVGPQVIAGIAFAIEDPSQVYTGFINFIDYTTGSFKVGGTMGDPLTGITVTINDPPGRYGRPQAPYPLFTADTDNPSVSALTGFPMCIPRSDPAVLPEDARCPQANRPKTAAGAFMTTFTMQPAGSLTGGTDPMQQAPLVVGDYVTVTGPLSQGANLITAFGVSANVGIFTAPGTKPVYVIIDVTQLGVTDPTKPLAAVPLSRMEGFTTDPLTNINLFAIDVDGCTGAPTNRLLAQVVPDVAVKGRWRWLPGKVINQVPSRQVLAVSNSGTLPSANGLTSGQYVFPVPFGGIVFPEVLPLGAPLGANQFHLCPWLVQGSGPYAGSAALKTAPGPVVGQLAAFPGIAPGPGPVCPAVAVAATVPVVANPVPVPANPVPVPVANPVPGAATPVPAEVITIVLAKSSPLRGLIQVQVSATSSLFGATNPANPVLTCTLPLGAGAVPQTMLLNTATGVYTATFLLKVKPALATVTSSGGGSATQAVI